MLVTLDARCRGSEHIKTDKPLQDFSGSTTDRWKSYAYALVADGHGGDKYFRSAEGSRLAVLYTVEAMTKVLKELMFYIKKEDVDVIDKTLKNLCSRVLLLWHEKVKVHFSENPLTEAEEKLCEKLKYNLPLSEEDVFKLYGTTLLSAVYFANYDFWFALQIGDGKCAVLNDGTSVFHQFNPIKDKCEKLTSNEPVLYPIYEDEEQGFGVTNSLCSSNAIKKFYYAFGFGKLSGICVMSDGMTDSFDTEKLPGFLLNIKDNVIIDAAKTKTELTEYLPKLSEQGSGDDISIAGIFVKEEESKVKNILNSVLTRKS